MDEDSDLNDLKKIENVLGGAASSRENESEYFIRCKYFAFETSRTQKFSYPVFFTISYQYEMVVRGGLWWWKTVPDGTRWLAEVSFDTAFEKVGIIKIIKMK